jgi:hypothetical protein
MIEFDPKDYANEPDDQNLENTLSLDEDVVMDKIIENINSTPIGQVLKKIAALPEVRKEKVINVRQKLTSGQYDLSDKLDAALDKVLEELIA